MKPSSHDACHGEALSSGGQGLFVGVEPPSRCSGVCATHGWSGCWRPCYGGSGCWLGMPCVCVLLMSRLSTTDLGLVVHRQAMIVGTRRGKYQYGIGVTKARRSRVSLCYSTYEHSKYICSINVASASAGKLCCVLDECILLSCCSIEVIKLSSPACLMIVAASSSLAVVVLWMMNEYSSGGSKA